jgi:molecular chaperone HtpG
MSQHEQEPKDVSPAKPETSGQGENFTFTAEIQKLLDILIHALYTHKEIFLRELISNAADALDKVRVKMLVDKNVRDEKLPLEITLSMDKEKNLLTVADSGIGMTREELIENIGTIAHSGSMSFLKNLSQSKDIQTNIKLIGQFGVGFYSVFMVARRVEILTLSASPQATASLWSSDGSGNYTIASAHKETRGTEIRVCLKEDDAKEYLEAHRIKTIVQRYSDFVSYPIQMEKEQINKLSAIWHRSSSEVKEEEYDEFFTYLTHMQEKPLAHIHLTYDAPIQFNSILFIPSVVPWDMAFELPEKWRGVHLYAKRIFIQSDCEELMPLYLRFVRGVVDSDDVPLNISRETLQENPVIGKIKKNLVRKVLEHLTEISEKRPDDYKKLWLNFGKFIKQGYRIEYEHRDKLTQLFRFNSSCCQTKEELISLQQYVDRMPKSQHEIYYLTGENRAIVEKSPHLEIFKKKAIEVLYLTDPVDDFLVQDLKEFQGKKLLSIDQEGISLEDIETPKSEKAPEEEKAKEKEVKSDASEREIGDLVGFLKDALKDRVTEVKISQKLVGSPCCLVASKDSPTIGMQKLFRMMHENYEMQKRTLEINKEHPLICRMAKIYAATPRDPILHHLSHQLVDNALLIEGSPMDTRAMASRLEEMMERVTDVWLQREKK